MRSGIVAAVLAVGLAVLAGCGKDDGGGVGALPEKTSPEAPTVKAVVEKLLGAVGTGDAEKVVREVATRALADRVLASSKASKPRTLRHEVRDVEVWGETAVARVRMEYPDVKDAPNVFAMTYELVKTPDGWRISDFRLRGDWEGAR